MDSLNELEQILLLAAAVALCVALPLVLRRFIDARGQRTLVRKNAHTLHLHYEHGSDAARLMSIPAEMRADGELVRVEFGVEFDGRRNSESDLRHAWEALEAMGLAVRSDVQEATVPTRRTLYGAISLTATDTSSLSRLRMEVERLAQRHNGAYVGWNARPWKRAG